MKSKTIGLILLIISILFLFIFISFKVNLNNLKESQMSSSELCFVNGECVHEMYDMNFTTYFGIIVLVLSFSFSFYLLFFEKKEKKLKVIKRYKKDDKFDIILSALSDEEKEVMKKVKEQDGVTQATLRIRTDFSKTKLSFILRDLENKGLIKKVLKGKTNQIFLKRKF